MNFASTVRKVDAKLNINFFAGQTDDGVEVSRSSTTNRGITKLQAAQILQDDLPMQTILSTFDAKHIKQPDGNIKVVEGIPLGVANLVARQTITGWLGNAVSDKSGKFDPSNPQTISVEYEITRRLPRLLIRSVDDISFPTCFNLIVNCVVAGATVYRVRNEHLETIDNVTFSRLITPSVVGTVELHFDFTKEARYDDDTINSVKLEILGWSVAGVLPRIAFFSGEMHETFSGNELQSIEVLEEKTGSVNALSYGISSNYLKASFLNRGRKFYRPANFAMLVPNRKVKTLIKCGKERYSLGKFFSEEWKLDDNSAFMSVKAYDILYSLQTVIINYGLDIRSAVPDANRQIDIRPFKNHTIQQVVNKIFSLIESVRLDNGLFDIITHQLDIRQDIANARLPYVLIAKKSAWEVLQDIANLICAYVYANRDGEIVIKWDEFLESHFVQEEEPTQSAFKGYKLVKQTYTIENKASIRKFGLRKYTYDATLFVTNDIDGIPPFVKFMAENILSKYKGGVEFVDTTWKGHLGLELKDNFEARSLHTPENQASTVFETLSNEITLANGLRQITKGRATENIKKKSHAAHSGQIYAGEGAYATSQTTPSVKHKIDPDNAFSFNLPVNNRVVVNQVNIQYYVLEKCTDPNKDRITIKKRDCRFDTTDPNKFTVVVKLEKVYDRIESVHIVCEKLDKVRFLRVVSDTANSLELEFDASGVFDEFTIQINLS